MRAFLPTLREKKRYLAIEILSEESVKYSSKLVSKAVWTACQKFMGAINTAKAGIWVIEEKWKFNIQRGLIKVNNRFVEQLMASLALISKINKDNIIIRSIGVSGIIKKAEYKYLR